MRSWRVATCGVIAAGMHAIEAAPIRLDPANGHYFEFRGKTTVLVGSSEHYGALINTDFDYLRYLDEVKGCGLNLVRVFSGAYRETPGAFSIPENTLSPEPGRFLAPWARSGMPGASDGGNKFDLTRWDAAYFQRLRDFVSAADQRGIVVELTLFCPHYDATLWAASPLNSANHINGVGSSGFAAVHQVNSDLLPYQKTLARKCAEELRTADNVFFEIINEPYNGSVPQAWQSLIINELSAAESTLPRPHLIAQNIANGEQVITAPHPAVSIFNFHYAQPNAALANLGPGRVIGDDETGLAGYTDFPYRREAWEFMLSGGGLFDHLDFSFTTAREDGLSAPIPDSGGGPPIRRELGVLRWFLEELPLSTCAPLPGTITGGIPSGGAARAFGSPETRAIYLRGGSQANLVVNLPAGTWRGRWLDPRSGAVTATVAEFTHAGGSRTLPSPVYSEDAALVLRVGATSPPEVRLTEPVHQSVAGVDSNLSLRAEASSIETIDRVEFMDGDEVLGTDNSPPYVLTPGPLPKGIHVFRARAVTVSGRTAQSPPARCFLTGSFQSAVNLNGETLNVNGQTWTSDADARAAGMVLANSQPLTTSAAVALYPTPDPLTQSLVVNQLVRPNTPANPELAISYPLPNGTYDVFISLIEGQAAYNRDMRVQIENITVARGIGNLALGEWVNYGPYPATVTDGILNIGLLRETKGSPKIAGFSVYQATAPPSAADATLRIGGAPGLARLSWPANIPADRVESSISLDPSASWLPLALPVQDFTDHLEMAVPTNEVRRFFRLRKD